MSPTAIKLVLRCVWYRNASADTNVFSDIRSSIASKPITLRLIVITKCAPMKLSRCVAMTGSHCLTLFNTLRPRQNGRQFPGDIFKCIFLTENVIISIKISLKFVPKGSINNIPTLVQIMAWRRSGDKSWSEPMVVGLLTHICVTRPQWVKGAGAS